MRTGRNSQKRPTTANARHATHGLAGRPAASDQQPAAQPLPSVIAPTGESDWEARDASGFPAFRANCSAVRLTPTGPRTARKLPEDCQSTGGATLAGRWPPAWAGGQPSISLADFPKWSSQMVQPGGPPRSPGGRAEAGGRSAAVELMLPYFTSVPLEKLVMLSKPARSGVEPSVVRPPLVRSGL